MRALILLLCLFLAAQAQFIKHNSWKMRSAKHKGELDFKDIFGRKSGSALIFEGSNLLTIVLLHPTAFERQFVLGVSASVIINVDFGELNPQNFGNVQGKFNLSFLSGDKELTGMREMTYQSGSKAAIKLNGGVLEVETEGAPYIKLILLSICQAGINILLLTVLVKRKRWSQVEPWFLMTVLGWQVKKMLILWFQCGFFFGNAGNCTCVIAMKYLLIILTIKSLKIVAQVVRISNNVLQNFPKTAGMAIIAAITMTLMPIAMLHVLVPACFLLQFRKYSRYSRLDFQVHYSLINLNLFLNAQLIYRLFTHYHSFSLPSLLLFVYSSGCVIIATIMGELYQYSPENNRSSPCLAVDFANNNFCPYCQEELYELDQHDESKSKDRHDLSYDLWKFGVTDCGHIFHCNCLLEVLRLQQGCPLLHHPKHTTHDTSNLCLNEDSKIS